MNFKLYAILMLVVVTLLCLVAWTEQGQSVPKVTWEYKVVISNTATFMQEEQMLNQRGAEGWELIQVEPSPGKFPGEGYYYFKRHK